MKLFVVIFLLHLFFPISDVHAQLAKVEDQSGLYELDAGGVIDNEVPAISWGNRELSDQPFVRSENEVRFALVAIDAATDSRKLWLLAGKKTWVSPGGVQKPTNASGGEAIQTSFDAGCMLFEKRAAKRVDCELNDGVSLISDAASLVLGGHYSVYSNPGHEGRLISRFKRVGKSTFKDILTASRSTHVYAVPSFNATVVHTISELGWFAVIAWKDEWVQVAVPSKDGTLLQGWLARRDLVQGIWVTQKSDDKRHIFRVAYVQDRELNIDYWSAIEVKTIATQKVQYLFAESMEMRGGDPALILDMVDVNFDGYLDVQIWRADGGAAPNVTLNYFLFEPSGNRFVFNQALSEMTQPSFDARKKMVQTAWRSSGAEHGWEAYRWHGRRLRKVGEGGDRWGEINGRAYGDITESWLHRGKWKSITRRNWKRR